MTSVLRKLPLSPTGPSVRATPPRRSPGSSAPRVRLHLKSGQKGTKQLVAQYGDRLLCVRYRFAFGDVAVRNQVKRAGGTWNPDRKVWQLRCDRAVALGLNSRIVDEPASNSGCPGSRGENPHADARVASR
jgi:hypothetical protein